VAFHRVVLEDTRENGCGTSNPNSEPQRSENGEKSSTAPPSQPPPQEAWKAFAEDMNERLGASGFPLGIPPLEEFANFFHQLFPQPAPSAAPDHVVKPSSTQQTGSTTIISDTTVTAPTSTNPLPPHECSWTHVEHGFQ